MIKVPFLRQLTITLTLTILALGSYSAFELTNTPCTSAVKQQSPINIVTSNVEYHEEEYFRIISQNFTAFNGNWANFPEDKTIGFNADVGSLIFVKDWGMHKFDLEKVLIRYGSAHKIDGQDFDLEMEFVFNYDVDYRPPGRYVYAGVDKLIISLFFVERTQAITEQDTEDGTYSFFFNITKIEDFAANPTSTTSAFEREIKLNLLIKQQPGYFYEGSEASGNCDSTWRFILPKYQTIPTTQLTNIKNILESLGYINTANGVNSNARNIQAINTSTIVLRNEKSTSRLLIEASSQPYTNSLNLSFSLLSILAVLFFFLF